MSVDLLGLPDVQFAELDTAKVESAIITAYEGIQGVTLYPGDPVRLFLSTLAAVIAQRNVLLDYTGKMNLLRYATGAYLDHIGAMLDVSRLDAAPAKTVMRFTLQEPQPVAFFIPAGVRVTASGQTFFATDALLTFPAGTTTGEIAATCQADGTVGNGFVPGQINRLVDPQPFVTSVENIETSAGGADVESDDSLRNRIRLKPESFTTAGSELSYVYWALTAHQDVADVAVVSPVPGVVSVFILLTGGRVPAANGPEIEAVTKAVSAARRRPLTDQCTVYPVDVEPIDYTLAWFITEAQSSRASVIEANIEAAVAAYETWQTTKIGRDINPDKLIRFCVGAGAKRVEITGLAFTPLDATKVAQIADNPNRITFGGVESE